VARRVTFLDHDEALAVRAVIAARHPDILDRLPSGVYRYQVSGLTDMRQALYDCWACDRVVAAWEAKKRARDKDLDRLRRAVETWLPKRSLDDD
jgi:hypothetical protein